MGMIKLSKGIFKLPFTGNKGKTAIKIFITVLISFQIFILAAFAMAEKHSSKAIASNSEHLKLYYIGTNETFSEALYHMDLQDGKLDEPHIVATLRKGDKPKVLKFINNNNKIIKQLEFKDNYDMEIIANNCVMVREKLVRPGEDYINAFNDYCYDNKGKLLWERKKNYYTYFMSPDGEIILEIFNFGPQQFSSTIEVSTLNRMGILLQKAYFPTKIGGENVILLTHQFSQKNDYLLDFDVWGNKGPIKRIYYIYNSAGGYISSYEAKGLPFKLLPNMDNAVKPLVIYDIKGRQILADNDILKVAFSADGNYISKIDTRGNIYIAKYNNPIKWQLYGHVNLEEGTVEDYKVIDPNNILINITSKTREWTPVKEIYQSTFYLLSQKGKYILSQMVIEEPRDDFISRIVKENIFILYCRHKGQNNGLVEQVSNEEPRYDSVQVFQAR